MDRRAFRGVPTWCKTQRRLHTAPVILPVVIDLHFTKRAENVGGSVVHERVPSVGEARVEWGEYRTPVLVRGVVGSKVRVGITGGRKF